jgi:hypothetical protein
VGLRSCDRHTSYVSRGPALFAVAARFSALQDIAAVLLLATAVADSFLRPQPFERSPPRSPMLCSVVQAALTDPRSSGRWRRISAIAATTAVARTPAMSHSVVDPCIGTKHGTNDPALLSSRASRGKLNRFRVRIPLRQFSATPSKFPTSLDAVSWASVRRADPTCRVACARASAWTR